MHDLTVVFYEDIYTFMQTPPFLADLGLDADADERAIRSAYAKRLKGIDQEADPAEFQVLHEAFEAAGRWVKARRGAESQDVGLPTSEHLSALLPPLGEQENASTHEPIPLSGVLSPSEDVLVTLDVLSQPQNYRSVWPGYGERPGAPLRSPRPRIAQGHAVAAGMVFAEFSARLVQCGQDGAGPDTVENLLAQALDDARLDNLQARFAFEFHIAELLANGWRAGHDLLLEAAAVRFRWLEDKQGLAKLGGVGTSLDQALIERHVFLKVSPSALALRLRLIERLRDPAAPTEQEVSAHHKTMVKLFIQYPNWLRLVTDVNNILTWRDGSYCLKSEVAHRTSIARFRKQNRLVQALTPIVVTIAIFWVLGLILKLFQ